MCSCRDIDAAECFCPILSAYAQECARVGIIVDWRSRVRSCGKCHLDSAPHRKNDFFFVETDVGRVSTEIRVKVSHESCFGWISGIPCPFGQIYQPCGNSCQRSCSDISHGEMCKGSCTEGCYCPSGQTLDENEECIPIATCPCSYRGRKYPAGYVDIRNKTRAWYVIICIRI